MQKLLLMLMILLAPIAGAAKTATEVLDAAAKRFQSVKSLTATYDMISGGQTSTGVLAISGEKFHLSSNDMSSWYDGTTQWTYSAASNEVNITSPTPEELAQVNPFVIISSLRKAYNSRLVSSSSTTNTVELTPIKKRGAAISKAVIDFSASTSFPTVIKLTTDGGETMTIRVKSIKTGTNYPASTFVFNKKQYPKAALIDLR